MGLAPQALAAIASRLGSSEIVSIGVLDAVEETLERAPADLIVIDLAGGKAAVAELVARIRSRWPRSMTILVDDAIDALALQQALHSGAHDLVERDPDRLAARVVASLARLEELDAARCEVERLLVEQQELSVFVVHDLKNPLAVVQANLEFLRSSGAGSDAELAEAIDDAREAASRLQRMVEDIGIVGRLERGERELEVKPLAVGALLEQVALTQQRAADRKQVALAVIAPAATCEADPTLLRRSLECLLEIALRHTPRGGQVLLELTPGDPLIIQIASSGAPVVLEDRARIFDKCGPGRQRGRAVGNVGFGLYLGRSTAVAHRGELEVVEREGYPTTFLLRLPRSRKTPASPVK